MCAEFQILFSGGEEGGLTHCDPLSMPSGALLQWLVCASLPGCGGGDSPKPLFLLSPSWASSMKQTSCLIHFLRGSSTQTEGLLLSGT